MSEVWRLRIDPDILEKADAVTERLGTSTQEMVRVFVAQIASTGSVPLKLDANDPLLDKVRRNRVLKQLDDTENW